MYFLLPFVFPSLTWRIRQNEKVLYLTFDDGPIPEITEWVLSELKKYNAKATFFCIGDNVKKHPDIYQHILSSGHHTGNHTQNHLNAWNVSANAYLKNTEEASQYINSKLFRPPYGKITPVLIRKLKAEYSIVMWDVLSEDYDINKTGSYCSDKVIRNAGKGSIIVFHDSIKAESRLKESLPAVLKHFHDKGYRFETLPV